jgi:hypothetical protein
LSHFAIHLTADIIGKTDSMLSRTRALLAPPQALRTLDDSDPLATIAAKR